MKICINRFKSIRTAGKIPHTVGLAEQTFKRRFKILNGCVWSFQMILIIVKFYIRQFPPDNVGYQGIRIVVIIISKLTTGLIYCPGMGQRIRIEYFSHSGCRGKIAGVILDLKNFSTYCVHQYFPIAKNILRRNQSNFMG